MKLPAHPNPLHHFPQPPGAATYATNTSPPDTSPTDATQHLSTGSTKPAPQHSYHSTTKNTGPAPSTHKTPPQPSSKQIRTHLNLLHSAHHNTQPEPSKQLQTPFKHSPQQITTHKTPPEQATHSTLHHKHKPRQPTTHNQETNNSRYCK